MRRGEDIAAGQRSVWILGRSVLLVWQTNSDRLVALVAGPRYLEQQWLSVLRPLMDRQGVRLALIDAEGHPVLAQFSATPPRQAVRNSAETQLPWTLHVVSRDPMAELTQQGNRRRLLLLAFTLVATFVLAGGDARARSRAPPVRLRFGCLARISNTIGLPSSTERTAE